MSGRLKRLFRLSALPIYTMPMRIDCPSSLAVQVWVFLSFLGTRITPAFSHNLTGIFFAEHPPLVLRVHG